MRSLALPPGCDHLFVRHWSDPVLELCGHDPRSAYVERFWLGLLGPSATWLVRYVADQFDATPGAFSLDLEACAAALGIGRGNGRSAALPKTLRRCCDFGVARVLNRTTIEVRRKLAPLNRRQLTRLPGPLQAEHDRWVDQADTADADALLLGRAQRMALSLLNFGEDPDSAQRQLQRWRFPAQMAQDAMRWAVDVWRGPSLATGDVAS
jgi:hypothetical protein